MKRLLLAASFMVGATTSSVNADEITVGFAIAKTGWLAAYDGGAVQAAKIRIDEINGAGGLLGQKVVWIEEDTETNRMKGAAVGLDLIRRGADMLVVSCDYDFGAPAALVAEAHGKTSFFLCAEDVKAGIQGVGPNSFSGSVLAALQGATMAEWSVKTRSVKTAYTLIDTSIEYSKSVCTGFDWMFSKVSGRVVGSDTFRNSDVSIAAQISRLKALPEAPDAIMLCSYNPGAAAAVTQIREAGIDTMILNGSAMDGTFWLEEGSDLSNFVVPVQGAIYGDDPRPEVEAFNQAFEEQTGHRPYSSYAYPGYILIDLWSKGVTRAGTVDGPAVTAELEKMTQEKTAFGPRRFSSELHHQNTAELQIIEITNAKPQVVGSWTISEPVPLHVLLK